ncbi:hypothetical protein K432DRAFT_67490 [Lepidopterella palustris CBS 459.81]|uniref:Phospholipid/glycerol acyltransferase domain-containing protein n=1 Tax=Lepidopterella palustris CBS 459.81 TaxID=1314670 RepID=A0A8E2EJT9_9PEZI|nr:hypothetical protein K432DRAFT_67490 [Lepidopterella palustris CBS 459.81]
MAITFFEKVRGVALLAPWLTYVFGSNLVVSLLLPLNLFLPIVLYNVSSVIANSVWSWIQELFVQSNHAQITVSASQELPREESAIIVANHVSWTDFYMIQELALRAGMLGRCRWFAKKQLRWVPFLGWGLWAMGMPFVSGNWTRDRKQIEKVFTGITQRKWPVWLISYSEGCRFTPSRYTTGVQWCKDHDRPIMKHTLYPRMHGFVATVNTLRHTKHVRGVYDITIAYAHGKNFMEAPSFWETIATSDLSKAGYKFYVHVDRYEMKELPETKEDLAKWLEGRWVKKGEKLEELKEKLARGEDWEVDNTRPE